MNLQFYGRSLATISNNLGYKYHSVLQRALHKQIELTVLEVVDISEVVVVSEVVDSRRIGKKIVRLSRS